MTDRDERIIALKATGLSHSEVGRAVGCSRRAVGGVLYRARHPRPPPKPRENQRQYVRRIWLGVDDVMDQAIRSLASTNRCTFAEAARTLIEWGLASVESTDVGGL